MVIIDLDQVSKRYLLHQRRQLFSQHAWKQIRRDVKSFWALRDVSFQLEEGERLGIIGANGAGKTTLLRLIAGIARPTSGAIRVHGRVGAVLGLGTGIHQDLTGRENVHLVASLMGLTRPEVRNRFDAIVEFSGLSVFIDEAVRAYSSGMVSRLGLSVAIHSDPEILVLDEVFAVGDAAFTKKCTAKMEEFTRSGRTVIFVSHSLETVVSMCNRVIWLDQGMVRRDGPAGEITQEYGKLALETAAPSPPESSTADLAVPEQHQQS